MNTIKDEPCLSGDLSVPLYESFWKDVPPPPFAVGDRVVFKEEFSDFTYAHGGWVYVQVLLRKRKLPYLTISEIADIYISFKEVQDLLDSTPPSFKASGFSHVPFKLINT